MTRRSKRELEHALADLNGAGAGDTRQFVIHQTIVDAEGRPIDTRTKVFDV